MATATATKPKTKAKPGRAASNAMAAKQPTVPPAKPQVRGKPAVAAPVKGRAASGGPMGDGKKMAAKGGGGGGRCK